VSVEADAPPGWTQISSKTSSNGYEREWIFYHVAASTEPVSYTWEFNHMGTVVKGAAGGIVAYYNVDTANPIDTSNGQFSARSTTIKATSISTRAANDRLLCFMTTFAGVSTSNWSKLPSGMTKEWLIENSGQSIDAATLIRP
jgi:hypothetical protein